ncbi:MAG: hypothetical protein IJJ10_02495, partial [Bacillus sp. (in: Bacteria)]|nr:hypothetical protein [Bacillus sp. (in: firmicutes)]
MIFQIKCVYQPKSQFISQCCSFISQNLVISANSAPLSAKIPIYQPTLHPYQPKSRYISQLCTLISQNLVISANSAPLSAKISLYQPTLHPYQPKSRYI